MNGPAYDARGRDAPCATLTLRMASRALSQIYDEAMRPARIKSTQFSLLRMIQRHGPLTFQGLAVKMVLDQTTLPRSLRTIEKDGFIRIEAGADRRERFVSLTQRGAAVLEKAEPHWQRAQTMVRRKFRGERLDKLLADLDQLRLALAK